MELRQAQSSDKKLILDFCRTTFAWGDYISDVWDAWFSEGNLLVLSDDEKPIAVCHVSIIKGQQVWIEGIRVNKKFRRKGHAKRLVTQAELIGKRNNCKVSKMLIESNNIKSLKLADNLNYENEEKWNFYSIYPKKTIYKPNVKFAKFNNQLVDFLLSSTNSYVRSWRWIPLTNAAISLLIDKKKILISESQDIITFAAIILDSDHFEKTLMITLVAINDEIENFLKYIQNYAHEKGYKRIQILTKLDFSSDNFKKKYSFDLMKKKL